jgi:hypothetical protein
VSAHNIAIWNIAIWNEDGSIPFFVREDEPGSRLMSTKAARTTGKEILVEAKRLSSFVNGGIDLLKLDVEEAGVRACDLLGSAPLGELSRDAGTKRMELPAAQLVFPSQRT